MSIDGLADLFDAAWQVSFLAAENEVGQVALREIEGQMPGYLISKP